MGYLRAWPAKEDGEPQCAYRKRVDKIESDQALAFGRNKKKRSFDFFLLGRLLLFLLLLLLLVLRLLLFLLLPLLLLRFHDLIIFLRTVSLKKKM